MSIEVMKRIKSLLQDTDKIDSHTISAVVAECDMVILAKQPATPEPVAWNSIQIASWIGSQLMHEPSMFERATVCKFVRSLGRHPTLLKHSPKLHPAPSVPDDVVRDAERLNDLESLVKSKGMHGLSFDYRRHVEDGYVVEKGFRLMWRHTLCERKPTLREAIDAAMLAA